jgi:Ca2+/H+ antiporter, TMEM165/GDT1 family
MTIWPLLSSFLVIFLAELGDKTQLLTIGFAAKFPFWEVILAVGAATGCLMALAVLCGGVLDQYIPAFYLQLFAAALFLFYGVKTLIDKEEEAETAATGGKGNSFGLIFAAFFLAEMGDKTQLAALALTTKYGAPFLVWLGATAGMIGSNIVGGLAGRWLHRKLSARVVRWFGGLLFLIFGLWTLGGIVLNQLRP